MVGAGSSYRDAALVARERAKRLRADPGSGQLRLSRHGSLVMDWVEVFAPVVFEPHRPRAWPPGSLLLDDLPFRVRDPGTAATGSRSGSSPRWARRPGGRGCGAWRRSRASPRLTGRRSWARWTGRRRGSCATTTTGSPRCARPLPRRRTVPVRVASAPRAGAADEQDPHRAAPAPRGDRRAAGGRQAAFTGASFWAPFASAATPQASRA